MLELKFTKGESEEAKLYLDFVVCEIITLTFQTQQPDNKYKSLS